MEVRRLEAVEVLTIRNKVLRPNEIKTDYIFPGDEDESTLHLGAFLDGTLVSAATFLFQAHPKIDGKVPVRLRGMATLSKHRKKGLSKALIETAMPIVKQNQCDVLWCEAREQAIGFYLSLGFQTYGGLFQREFIGPHQLMYLTL
jgi:GNAT superfamily N-acetyltransferase